MLEDETLKHHYWPHNVTKILNKYDLPDATYILKSEPMKKIAFKRFAKEKIVQHHMNITNSRIMLSNMYRFIYKDDFSYARKRHHPLVSSATTTRQTVALKLNLMHLCMEYPNGENRERIKMKKHNNCEICLEVGRTELDSSEHNLFFCECLLSLIHI